VARRKKGTQLISLELGCVRLTERLVQGDPPALEELERIRSTSARFSRRSWAPFDGDRIDRAVGVGALLPPLAPWTWADQVRPSRIENHLLSREKIASIEKHLCSIP